MQGTDSATTERHTMPSVVYMTAGSADEADAIARVLVERRLAACVNILGPIRSIYRWQGAVEEATETAFIAKTAPDKLDELIETVRGLHSYTVPCIVALPITAGNLDFITWIHAETR